MAIFLQNIFYSSQLQNVFVRHKRKIGDISEKYSSQKSDQVSGKCEKYWIGESESSSLQKHISFSKNKEKNQQCHPVWFLTHKKKSMCILHFKLF